MCPSLYLASFDIVSIETRHETSAELSSFGPMAVSPEDYRNFDIFKHLLMPLNCYETGPVIQYWLTMGVLTCSVL